MYGIHTFSEAGGHPTNEDSFAIEYHPEDSNCLVGVVADGQGGRAGAYAAAQIACRTTLETALSYSARQLVRPGTWPAILGAADRAVHDSPEAGFTTLVAACIMKTQVCGASSGDSAAIAVSGRNSHEQLTSKQIKNPPVGSGLAVFVPFASRLVAPWLVVLMSDGVWKFAGWDMIDSIVTRQHGDAMMESLRASARLPGSEGYQDDFTVLAVHDA